MHGARLLSSEAESSTPMSGTLACYGIGISLEGFSPQQIQELGREGFETGSQPHPQASLTFRLQTDGRYFNFSVGETPIVSNQTWPLIKQVLLSYLQLAVRGMVPELVFVQADAVAWGDGAILLPGRSFAGKTTLGRALVERGCRPWAERHCALDLAGCVYPFPRSEQPAEGLPVRGIFELTYVPGHSWSVAPLTPGQASLSLAALLASRGESPGAFLPRLAETCARAAVRLQGKRGEAGPAADSLLAELAI